VDALYGLRQEVLRFLNLSRNAIDYTNRNTFAAMTSLILLDLSSNRLTQQSVWLTGCTIWCTWACSIYEMTTFTTAMVFNDTNLRFLYMDRNDLRKTDGKFGHLHKLIMLRYNETESLTIDMITNCTRLICISWAALQPDGNHRSPDVWQCNYGVAWLGSGLVIK
jgi:hypothetical protein